MELVRAVSKVTWQLFRKFGPFLHVYLLFCLVEIVKNRALCGFIILRRSARVVEKYRLREIAKITKNGFCRYMFSGIITALEIKIYPLTVGAFGKEKTGWQKNEKKGKAFVYWFYPAKFTLYFYLSWPCLFHWKNFSLPGFRFARLEEGKTTT